MSGKKYKVLIVDDSELNRTILAEILKSEYEIIEAENGERAVDILLREEDVKKSQEAGMNEHITKPFNREKLEQILSKYLYTN